jgi:phosphoglycolate phosphatase
MINKKIVVFDFDGVIADSFATQLEAALEIIEEMGIDRPKMTIEEIKDFVRINGHLELLKLINFPKFKIFNLLSLVKKKQGQKIITVKIFKGIKIVLKKLAKKYDLYLLTGNTNTYIDPFLKSYKIDKLFKGMYSDTLDKGKKVVFNNFNNDHKDEILNSYYIGDEVSDINDSQKIGFKCIASTWGITSVERLSASNPYAIATSPLDIMNYIK